MLDYQRPRIARPLWVRIGLWGLPNRNSAVAFAAVSLLIGIGCVAAAFFRPILPLLLTASFAFIAACHYWAALRWVDRNDQWD